MIPDPMAGMKMRPQLRGKGVFFVTVIATCAAVGAPDAAPLRARVVTRSGAPCGANGIAVVYGLYERTYQRYSTSWHRLLCTAAIAVKKVSSLVSIVV